MILIIGRQTAIYAQGAGLGASKGKEIGKYGEGYSGYVHMAQDGVSCEILFFDI
jgi:RNA-binding protein 5/10